MRKRYVALMPALLICLVQMAVAQATEFTYQGRLLFGDVPANGSYDFEFALFDSDSGGNQVGSTFPVSAVNVNNGVFSVRIDFGNQFPGASRFLEIHVRQSGATAFAVLSPRQSISSAPYSIKSLNSANSETATNALALGGTRANQFVTTNDSRLFDARDPRPGSASYVQNTNVQQPISNFNVSGDGTAGGTLSGNAVNSMTRFTIGGVTVLNVTGGPTNTFAGIRAGEATTPATDGSTNGLRNSMFGNEAGKFNTTGSSNSFFGFAAGQTSTTGSSNSFFGQQAGLNNGAGHNNSYFGIFAGLGDFGTSSSGGSANSFFGSGAGSRNGTGNNNSALGANANFSAPDLSFATAIGSLSSVSSSDTIVLGKVAGSYGGVVRPADTVVTPGSLVVGSGVTVGDTATIQGVASFGKNVTVSSSLAIGTDVAVGRGLTVGDTATILGVASFGKNVTVGSSLALGTDLAVGRGLTVGDTATINGVAFFGRNVTVSGTLSTASNLSTSTSLGVGTTTPVAKLDVSVNSGHILIGHAGCNPGFVGIGFGTTLSGCANYSLLGNGTDTIINRPSGGAIHFREANSTQLAIATGGFVGIGTASPTAPLTVFAPNTARFDLLTSSPANPSFGYSQSVRADGQWILATNTGSSRIAVDGSGFVAIGGTPTSAARLSVNGDLRASGSLFVGNLLGAGVVNVCLTGSGGFLALCSSSIRYKSNIRTFTPGLDLIKRLRPVSFNWKSNNAPDMGLVAEDVGKVEPLLVTHNEKGEVEGIKYDRVGVVLVNAVNEQQAEIESLRKVVETQNEALKQQKEFDREQQAEIDALKKVVCSGKRSTAVCRTKN